MSGKAHYEKMEMEDGRGDTGGGNRGRKTGCYLSTRRGPPCITSLRCFGTDDIVGLGGGPALEMMSLITNQRTREAG